MRAEEDERGRGKTERGRMVRGETGGGGRRENKGESGERVWTAERVISTIASDTASLNCKFSLVVSA